MKNRGGKLPGLGAALAVMIVLAVGHIAFHFHKYNVTGISGFALSDENSPEQDETSSQRISLILIAVEVLVITSAVVAIKLIRKRNSRREIRKIIAEKKEISTSSKTDIDVLYEILKHQKELGIEDIASAFSVSKEVAMEWCKILEENDMADIEYASIGEPSIRLK